MDHFPPRQIFEDGQPPRGQNIQITKALGKVAGFTPEFSGNVAFKRCLSRMKEGSTDIMIGLVETSSRAPYMEFVPYMKAFKKRFFSLSMRNLEINNLSDLDGLTVAMVEGFAYSEDIAPLLTNTTIKEVDSIKQAFTMAARHEVDAVFASEYVNIELDAALMGSPVFVASNYALHTSYTASIAVSKKSPAIHYLSQLKHAAEQLNAKGVIEDIIERSEYNE
ncbi:substrate-binding periplasmic protein [Alteromonas sediminis]|nr:transporter substrate-binding domain-containing protein [Alteromonas sediminis]